MDKKSLVIKIIDDFKEPLANFLEDNIDSLMNNEIIKSFPILGVISAIYKGGKNVNEYLFNEKLLQFLEGLNDKSLTEEEIIDHYNKLRNNNDLLKKETKYILNIINSSNEASQTLRLGYLYLSYIKGKIETQELFFELAEVNNRILEPDLRLLFKFSSTETKECDYKADRLTSLGLLTKITNILDNTNDLYKLTEFGKIYCKVMADYYPEVAYKDRIRKGLW